MTKPFRFLKLEIYRRTFLLCTLISILFSFAIGALALTQVHEQAQAAFRADAQSCFARTERELSGIEESVDQFITRLYTSPRRLEDFYRFFCTSPSEYERARLDNQVLSEEGYPESCDQLMISNRYQIRHILYVSPRSIVDMEYSSAGCSRLQTCEPGEADALRNAGSTITRQILRNSAYEGTIEFIVDVRGILASTAKEVDGMQVYAAFSDAPATPEDGVDYAAILASGTQWGTAKANGSRLFYCVLSSPYMPCSVVYTAAAAPYYTPLFGYLGFLLLGLLLAFGLNTVVLMRQFSRDSAYMTTILGNMKQAEKNEFTKLDAAGRTDELGVIAAGLNSLYEHLNALIEREYKLTISQQQTQMDMLSAQLNPHFLYNTLERIRMRAAAAGENDVAQAVADLGLLYRNITKTEAIIPISRELEITRQYLDLMSFLYGDSFLYYFDVDSEAESILTPKIWMQPIMENFFKHNFRNDEQIKVIVLRVKCVRGGTEFRFFDNVGELTPEQLAAINDAIARQPSAGGIGLRNVSHRLRLYYGDRVKMLAENNRPAGVCIRVFLRKEEPSDVPASDR